MDTMRFFVVGFSISDGTLSLNDPQLLVTLFLE